MRKTRATTSLIWKYFDISGDAADKKATCKYCSNVLSYKSTITNLKLHLIKRHIAVYKKYCQTESKNNGKNERKVKIKMFHNGLDLGGTDVSNNSDCDNGDGSPSLDEPIPSTSNTIEDKDSVVPVYSSCKLEAQFHPLKKQQRTKSPYTPRVLRVDEKTQIDNCLLKLITTDLQPFSIVENEGFKNYTHALNPNYEIPHRKTLSNKLLPAEYETRLLSTKEMIKDFCTSICLTVDRWTSRNLVPYIAVTGHFIHTETLEYKSILLRCSALESGDTGVKIAEMMKDIANEWNITHKVNFFVTNNATNMITAAQLLDWEHFGCYVHKLNLIVQEALNLRNIDVTIQKVQKIVGHFKRNNKAKEKLFKYQVNQQNIMPGCEKGLLINMPTRWNSTYIMLQRFSELQEALKATIPQLTSDLPIISTEEWQCIEQLIEVLKPLHEVAQIMSVEKYLTASKAVVITQGLVKIYERLMEKEYFASIKECVNCLRDEVNIRFMNLEMDETIGMCTYLDPRFKEHAFNDEEALTTIKYILIDKVHALSNEDDATINIETEKLNTDILSVWIDFDQKVRSDQAPKSAETRAIEEVEMYVKEAIIPRNSCPLQWWREHKNIYPSLFSLFIKYCNIMVTSVSCEREFTKAGYIISDRRTRLTSSKVTQIMFLNANGYM